MKAINSLMPYIYGILIIALIVTFIMLIMRLGKTMKKVALLMEDGDKLNTQFEKINAKTEAIKQSADSWGFFLSLAAVAVIIKETFKYYKSERSLPKSFSKAVIRHAGQLGKLKF